MRRMTLAAVAVVLGAYAVTYAAVDAAPSGPTTPRPAPTVQPAEDSPAFNCLTMGNRRCGSGYRPVPGPVTTELDLPGGCLILYGDTSRIVCPDGRIETS